MSQSIFENTFVVVVLGLGLCVGLVLTLVGTLAALLAALGMKRWLWAIPMLFLGPLVALPYVFFEPDAEYAKSLLVKGVVLTSVVLVIYLVLEMVPV